MYSKPMRILLIEDNPHYALLILKVLANKPFCTLRAVEDEDQVLAYLYGESGDSQFPSIDLILFGLNLQTTEGHELLAVIKANHKRCHIPILVFGESGRDDDVNTSYALDANCYIEKPRDPMRFAQVVQQAVDFWLHTALLPE